MTFPRTVGQIPVYYSQLRTGRPVRQGVNTRYASRYLDCPNDPLYPFGFGLTYGRCRLSTLEVNERQARVKLSNTGGREAVETVQLYVVQRTAQIARPVRQLRDFQQVTVAPGESVWLHFDLTQEMFCYPYKGHHIFEPGIFTIMVGLDSAHVLSKDREITKACFDALRKESL